MGPFFTRSDSNIYRARSIYTLDQSIADFESTIKRADLDFMKSSSNAIKPIYPRSQSPSASEQPEPAKPEPRIFTKSYSDEYDRSANEGKSVGELECYFNNLSNYICRLEQQRPAPESLIAKLRRRIEGLQAHLDDLKSGESYFSSIRASGSKRVRAMARSSGGIPCDSCGRYCKCARISDVRAYSVDESYPPDVRISQAEPRKDRLAGSRISSGGAGDSAGEASPEEEQKEASGLICDEKFEFNDSNGNDLI